MTAEKHRLSSSSCLVVIVQALRDSPAYDSFLRRWKLSVYFSLRFQVQASATLFCSAAYFRFQVQASATLFCPAAYFRFQEQASAPLFCSAA